jgi:hypothetical protein
LLSSSPAQYKCADQPAERQSGFKIHLFWIEFAAALLLDLENDLDQVFGIN